MLKLIYKSYIIITFIILSSGYIKSQTYRGENYEMFKTMHNDPRSAAMGGVGAALFGNPLQVKNNAASSSFVPGAAFEYSELTLDNSNSNQTLAQRYGASLNTDKYGAFTFVYNKYRMIYYDYGMFGPDEIPGTGKMNKIIPTYKNCMLNYSYLMDRNLGIGINLNYLEDEGLIIHQNAFLFDIGILKRIIIESEESNQNFYIGLSFSNITNMETVTKKMYYEISGSLISELTKRSVYPSELRIGIFFDMETRQKYFGLNMFKYAIVTEYIDLVNCSWYSTFKFGLEFTFLEMLNLRVGFYNEKNGESFNATKNSGNSFGAGVKIPVDWIIGSRFPVSVNFDYANFSAPYYVTNSKRYQVFSGSMNYMF